jgi:hypothetical protein
MVALPMVTRPISIFWFRLRVKIGNNISIWKSEKIVILISDILRDKKRGKYRSLLYVRLQQLCVYAKEVESLKEENGRYRRHPFLTVPVQRK